MRTWRPGTTSSPRSVRSERAGETARVFVGLGLGALGSRVLAAAAEHLDGAAWRLPRAEGLHLTLVFLGDVERAALEPLARALDAACAELAAPALVLGGTGAFPPRGRPRVLWVAVREEGAAGRLAALQRAAVAAARAAGLDPGSDALRQYRAHVTIARPRRPGARVGEGFAGLALDLPFRPDRVVLYESVRAAEGPPTYAERHAVELGGP